MVMDPAEHWPFIEELWDFYAYHGRDLLWRRSETDGSFDPYKIMVSELMLQQTQVGRVTPKYTDFLQRFPTVHTLAHAELGDVLRAWQGLGYNRRARFLWQAAQVISGHDRFPATVDELIKLPGIGANTAGAILVYAYNQPIIFIETNVRTVYIYHFFADRSDVTDKEIRTLLEQTLDRDQPREFYWAIMDYGSHLKATIGNLNKLSRHYTKQPQFNGSKRQLRGAVIRALSVRMMTNAELHQTLPDERLEAVLRDLTAEGLVSFKASGYAL